MRPEIAATWIMVGGWGIGSPYWMAEYSKRLGFWRRNTARHGRKVGLVHSFLEPGIARLSGQIRVHGGRMTLLTLLPC